MEYDEQIAEGHAALAKLKAAAFGAPKPAHPTADDVSKAFGVNLDHLKPNYEPEMQENPIDLEALQRFKEKLEKVQHNEFLSKHLPKNFLGSGDTSLDKFGNAIPEETKAQKLYLLKSKNDQSTLATKQATYKKTYDDYFVEESAASNKDQKIGFGVFKTQPHYYKPSYDINKDQLLIGRIGVASNLNVTIQEAFSASAFGGRKIRLFCRHCSGERVYYDMDVFRNSENELHEDIMEFCVSHAHLSETKLNKLVNHKALPVVVETEGRRFREED